MTPIELAVEHELIVAGAWYPGMRAAIVDAIGGDAAKPDAKKIRELIAEQRKDHPERFLPDEDFRDVGGTDDPAGRYIAALTKITSTRFHALRMLSDLRSSESPEP